MITIAKNCTTCIYEHDKHLCSKYCVDFKNHEFKCDYCIHKFISSTQQFCELENDDGSQNCCGDHFEFNNNLYKIEQ